LVLEAQVRLQVLLLEQTVATACLAVLLLLVAVVVALKLRQVQLAVRVVVCLESALVVVRLVRELRVKVSLEALTHHLLVAVAVAVALVLWVLMVLLLQVKTVVLVEQELHHQ
jgi:hypothetical protein